MLVLSSFRHYTVPKHQTHLLDATLSAGLICKVILEDPSIEAWETHGFKRLPIFKRPNQKAVEQINGFLDCACMVLRDRMAFSDHNLSVDDYHRVMILIDGASLFFAAAALDFEVDYEKLLVVLAQKRRLVQSVFYTGVSPGNVKQQSFLNWMQNHRYRVVSKPLAIAADGSRRAELMVEMAVDMLLFSEQCDTIILVSHNPTLTYAVNAVASKGTQIELVGARRMVGSELINFVDRFIDLEILKPQIQRS